MKMLIEDKGEAKRGKGSERGSFVFLYRVFESVSYRHAFPGTVELRFDCQKRRFGAILQICRK